MLNNQLLIHIGYPKTASTWLQQEIFKDEKMGFFSPWRGHWSDSIAVDQFITVNSFSFSPENAYAAFENGLKEGKKKHLCTVLSQEMLSCNFMDQSGYWGKEVAQRLYQVFPKAKILIVIREQKSMIFSAYGHYIRKGGRHSIEQLISTKNIKSGLYPLLRLYCLEYHYLINYYYNLFGENQVLVLPFELLKKDKNLYLQKICQFVGIENQSFDNIPSKETNVNYKAATLAIHRKINNFILFQDKRLISSSNSWRWIMIWKILRLLDNTLPEELQNKAKSQIKDFIQEYTENMFVESNQKTSELININLRDFGYDLMDK
ncbi:sulfotransferase domain-containing protein [Geminocystis sp.]|uniref:sulfotransferase domain-containing protein n=1 Tax=Geminocystis sp. TaxID=2664100 RepID=UPI0035944638